MLKINIVRGSKDLDPVVQQIQFMEAKRSLSGDIMIFDHDLIDIVVSKEKSKVSVFPKETISEESTYVQEKLLSSLARNGIVERESIRSGSVYSSMEASILESKDEEVSSFQVTLLELYNFLESERPNIESRKHFKQKVQDFFLIQMKRTQQNLVRSHMQKRRDHWTTRLDHTGISICTLS